MEPHAIIALEGAGEEMYALARTIFPITRSITGEGNRETFRVLQQKVPGLTLHEVPTGTQVFDWTVPLEWRLREAYIKNARGERIVDVARSNLHIVSYSRPVRERMGLGELRKHLHSLPDQPDLIPYRTSYYAETWGFCLSHRQLMGLEEGEYEVVIDSSLQPGALTYAEYKHQGAADEEVLLSAHACHPSLANDNCSGMALLACLAARMAGTRTRLSYRFVFAPGTIGAITWLARNEDKVGRIGHGLVVACVGDAGGPTYKRSRRGNALVDRAMCHVLARSGMPAVIEDFSPIGYDERQYGSPAFNLPVGLFERSKWGTFPQYHTSADNLDFIGPQHLEQSLRLIVDTIEVLEADRKLVNTQPKCEPMLGRRGLYSLIGGQKDSQIKTQAVLWVLNMSDGTSSLLDIAERSGMRFGAIREAAGILEAQGLVVPAEKAG